MSEVVKEFKNSVEKSISFYKEELKGVRTGRASVAMFENIKVASQVDVVSGGKHED